MLISLGQTETEWTDSILVISKLLILFTMETGEWGESAGFGTISYTEYKWSKSARKYKLEQFCQSDFSSKNWNKKRKRDIKRLSNCIKYQLCPKYKKVSRKFYLAFFSKIVRNWSKFENCKNFSWQNILKISIFMATR